MKLIYCVLIMLCPYMSGAQRLEAGQPLPPVKMNMVNHTSSMARTADYKGKLLLVDFWATWCGNCIKKFSMLDSMQRQYPTQLQVLLVNSRSTGDTEEKLQRFFGRYKTGKGTATILPTAWGDTVFKKLFPHYNLPHYAWINKAGELIATTGPDEVTPQNIALALQGKTDHISGLFLMDSFHINEPLFINGNAGRGQQIISRTTFTGYIPGLITASRFKKDSAGKYTGFTIVNAPLLHLITMAYAVFLPDSRIVISDALAAQLAEKEGAAHLNNYYGYERIGPPVPKAQLQHQIQRDIQQQFGIAAKWQQQPSDVYALTVESLRISMYKTLGGKPIRKLGASENKRMLNQPLATLTEWLDATLSKYVVQKDSLPFHLDITIPDAVAKNEPALIAWLQSIGIQLTPAIENINRFIIYPSPN